MICGSLSLVTCVAIFVPSRVSSITMPRSSNSWSRILSDIAKSRFRRASLRCAISASISSSLVHDFFHRRNDGQPLVDFGKPLEDFVSGRPREWFLRVRAMLHVANQIEDSSQRLRRVEIVIESGFEI